MEYQNKVILITGASSGIGRAVALALSRHDNTIIITARRKALLEETADAIRENGSKCHVISGDALDENHGEMVVRKIVGLFSRIDIAVLNIGSGPPINTLTASKDKILHSMRINYDTMINFFCPLIAQMKTQKNRCMIAHMNSLATYFGIPMQGDYTAAKGAARLFLETARMELKHFSIDHILIQTIHPGFVDTEAVKNDGVPAPNEISEEEAAQYVLKGFRSEVRENMFPFGTKMATTLGRAMPNTVLTKALLSSTPTEY